jgi:c-di-GMP-binding flagellar brake protein YcgR
MSGLPAMNQLISLRTDNGQEFASRVEGVDDGQLSVARPLDLPAEHELRAGSKLMVAWHIPNGIWVLPCVLVQVYREGLLSLWAVEVSGEAWREQRRAFVRAAVMGTVSLIWTNREEEFEASGVLADLSEASLRFTTGDEHLSRRAPAGTEVELTLRTPGNSFTLPAQVVRVSPSDQRPDGPRWQVVLVFINPGRIGDDIRRIVFNQQLRERNGPA